MSIRVTGVSKSFGKQKALHEVSFEVRPGFVTGFLGPNGAGKSTMMKIICGYLPADAGMAEVCGIRVDENPIEARRHIGYLPEHNPLYLDMYVEEYLLFVLGLFGIRKDRRKRVNDMIERVGLFPEKHKKLSALSKGYRQRAGIAQALIHDPDVLILDEPTSGLDPNQLGEIRSLIAETGKNKTVLFSSHILPEVEAICSRIIMLDKGIMVANDDSSSIKSNLTKSLLTIQVEFDREVNQEELKSIAGIIEVKKTGNAMYLLGVHSKDDVRTEVSKKARDMGWLILSMQQKESDLESVFRNLTSGKK